jgi:hypothetical protein
MHHLTQNARDRLLKQSSREFSQLSEFDEIVSERIAARHIGPSTSESELVAACFKKVESRAVIDCPEKRDVIDRRAQFFRVRAKVRGV